jgi:4-hydroxybenzoate polyprenyltransferase
MGGNGHNQPVDRTEVGLDESMEQPRGGGARGRSRGALDALRTYGRFVRLAHTVFSLPLVSAGMLIGARGWPPLKVFLLVLVAAAGARTTALALNRIIDRQIDARNPRTAVRELPSGAMTLGQAWGVLLAGLAAYLVAAALLGRFILLLSPIPLIVFAGYPYLKRFTPLCHLGVGLGLGLSPLGGWVAVTSSLHGLGQVLPLGLFGLFWVAGFDVIYATLDEEFDRACGVHSLPATLGRGGALAISFWLHLFAVLSLLALWWVNSWSRWSLALLVPAAFLLWLEQRLAANVELAFFRINIVVGFAVLVFVAAGMWT